MARTRVTKSVQSTEKELLDSWAKYLDEHRDELLRRFKGKYVATLDGQVVDSDPDLSSLAEHAYATHGYRPIFMPHIGDEPQVLEFTSLSPLA
ncbi:MAG: hypothetical protein HYX92_04925 [Chloroflexi bacterium]|nr:hypothetical protein [Chloroflexota bacterium]